MFLKADMNSLSHLIQNALKVSDFFFFSTAFVKFSILSVFTDQFKFLWWWTAGTSYIPWPNSRGCTNSLPHSPHQLCCQPPWWTYRHPASWYSSITNRSTSQACRLSVTGSRSLGRGRDVNVELPWDTSCFEDIRLCCGCLVKVA